MKSIPLKFLIKLFLEEVLSIKNVIFVFIKWLTSSWDTANLSFFKLNERFFEFNRDPLSLVCTCSWELLGDCNEVSGRCSEFDLCRAFFMFENWLKIFLLIVLWLLFCCCFCFSIKKKVQNILKNSKRRNTVKEKF